MILEDIDSQSLIDLLYGCGEESVVSSLQSDPTYIGSWNSKKLLGRIDLFVKERRDVIDIWPAHYFVSGKLDFNRMPTSRNLVNSSVHIIENKLHQYVFESKIYRKGGMQTEEFMHKAHDFYMQLQKQVTS